jgi:hypothetical protein
MRTPFVVAVGAVLVTASALAMGYRTTPKVTRPNPIRLEHGVPVGVLDTPAGAVAAADNDVASEDDALLSPDEIRGVVDTEWAPQMRAVELTQPFLAAALASKPAAFAGVKLTAAVAADKLDAYSPQRAQVSVWSEITIWSSTVAPTQRWALDTVTLAWGSEQWLVTSRSAAPDSATPVPAWTSGGMQDRASTAFDTRLTDMAAPYYGGAAR